VQIRTAEMHRVAEEGIAAHWKYKEGRHGASRDEQYFIWLRQLLEFQQEVHDPQEFLQNLKVELYPEEVYIFTPKGEVKALPRDASPVDFAYAIHTDVGHQCTGARVNGKMVPLRTRLRNGDIVEVLTTPGHHPSRDWLNFVVTSRARNKIKHYIHAEEKERSLDLGKKVFEKEARRYGLNLKSLTEGPAFAAALAEYGYAKSEELFTALGYGKLAVKTVLAKLVPQEQLKETPESGLAQVASVVRRLVGTGEEKIKVRGFDDLMVFRARCCNPIRGEKIVGYITRGKGVSVHSATCPNVVNLLYDPERRIEVEWDKATDASPYTVRLSLQVEDRKGILADVTSKIAGINTNIRNVEATSDADARGRIDMTVEISDVKHLQKVIKSLRSVEGVVDVERASR
jgi:guanosine-3',5'-bis(diphosphate) 3'-pyrophosphohydrolase